MTKKIKTKTKKQQQKEGRISGREGEGREMIK